MEKVCHHDFDSDEGNCIRSVWINAYPPECNAYDVSEGGAFVRSYSNGGHCARCGKFVSTEEMKDLDRRFGADESAPDIQFDGGLADLFEKWLLPSLSMADVSRIHHLLQPLSVLR